jgi:hypothetical protein
MAAEVNNKREIDEETRNKMRFVTFLINFFALTYKMNRQQAYLYLAKYGGLDFLFENWWALHTDNEIWAVRDLYNICYQNGGLR